MQVLIAVFLGGGLGSLLRYLVSLMVARTFDVSSFPLGTVLANVFACTLLGAWTYYGKQKWEGNDFLHFFIATGLCGGFSTFSTFSLENVKLAQNGQYLFLGLNLLISLGLGFVVLVWWSKKI